MITLKQKMDELGSITGKDPDQPEDVGLSLDMYQALKEAVEVIKDYAEKEAMASWMSSIPRSETWLKKWGF